MSDGLETQVAIVTGAGRGIGRETAIELSSRGWSVVLLSRTRDDLEATAEECPGDTLVLPLDVGEASSALTAVAAAVEGFGRLDAVINNAGVAPLIPFEETDDTVLARTLDLNLSATFRLSRAAWGHLKQEGGVIVNISSRAARDPFPGFSAYAAAKAGVEGLTVALAIEGAPHEIRCVCIAPGGTETQMFRTLPGMAEVPAEALMDPAEVGQVIADVVTGPLRYASGETIQIGKKRS